MTKKHEGVKSAGVSFVFCSLFFLSTCVQAQYDYGGRVSFMHFGGPTNLHHFGAGLRFSYNAENEWLSGYAGVGVFLPKFYLGEVEVSGLTPSVDPGTMTVPSDSRISFTGINAGLKYYFVGTSAADNVKPLAVYGASEFSLLFGSTRSNIPSYDETMYLSPIQDEVSGVIVNYIVGFGLGVEYAIGTNYLYGETKCRLTVDEANKLPVQTDLPWALIYNFGIRIPFGDY